MSNRPTFKDMAESTSKIQYEKPDTFNCFIGMNGVWHIIKCTDKELGRLNIISHCDVRQSILPLNSPTVAKISKKDLHLICSSCLEACKIHLQPTAMPVIPNDRKRRKFNYGK